MRAARPRVIYLAPAHFLLPTVGPTRNVLSLAEAMAEFAEVTVAFRRNLADAVPEGVRTLELDPGAPLPTDARDDAATKGEGAVAFAVYLRRLHAFLDRHLGAFDLVLEKTWLLSGTLSRRAIARGIPALAIENFAPDPERYAHGLKRLRLESAMRLAGRALRSLPRIVAETEPLKRALVRSYALDPARISVVPLGIDRELFRPRPQAEARARLGVPPEETMLVYVGVIDATHDLGPALEGLARLAPEQRAGMRIHVVGEGRERERIESFARRHALPVLFHGRVPHEQVPLWIAAADLCLAPYDASVFAGGELGYSTMKVPEYLAVGRPVAAAPSGRPAELIRHGENGFLFDNRPELWQPFLGSLPPRERLAAMGEAAARVPLPSWQEVAQAYLELASEPFERRRS